MGNASFATPPANGEGPAVLTERPKHGKARSASSPSTQGRAHAGWASASVPTCSREPRPSLGRPSPGQNLRAHHLQRYQPRHRGGGRGTHQGTQAPIETTGGSPRGLRDRRHAKPSKDSHRKPKKQEAGTTMRATPDQAKVQPRLTVQG